MSILGWSTSIVSAVGDFGDVHYVTSWHLSTGADQLVERFDSMLGRNDDTRLCLQEQRSVAADVRRRARELYDHDRSFVLGRRSWIARSKKRWRSYVFVFECSFEISIGEARSLPGRLVGPNGEKMGPQDPSVERIGVAGSNDIMMVLNICFVFWMNNQLF